MGGRGQSSWLAHLGVHAERADVACVGFRREVANKPHAAPALLPLSLPEGPGAAWVMVLHAGTASVKPETSRHPSAPRLSDRIRSDAFSASVAVFMFTPAASYMRGIGLPGPMAFLGGWSAAVAQTAMECDQVAFVSTNEST
jgi:hypothetical protein